MQRCRGQGHEAPSEPLSASCVTLSFALLPITRVATQRHSAPNHSDHRYQQRNYARAKASTAVRRVGKRYETTGWLTLLGIRKEVTFPFEVQISPAKNGQSQAELRGEAKLKRTDIVGDEVVIAVEIKAIVPET